MSNDLDPLRRQAKSLQKAYEAGDSAARMRVRAVAPRTGDLKRADFLHVIARENGFASWPALKASVEALGMDRAARLQALKVALMHGQVPRIKALIEASPDLAEGHFGLNCALMQAGPVLDALDADPGLATRLAGPRRPLLHLAFSRALQIWPERQADMLRIAEALVAHGADVNDPWPAPQDGSPLSALYGALGFADNLVLAEWLLARGADPNDGESLYHATELGHRRGVALLLQHGARPQGTNALLRAMDFDDAGMVRMLLEAGADPNEGDGALHHAALRHVSPEICDLLLQAGADPARVARGTSAYAYARVLGHAALAERIAARGPVPALTPEEALLAQAAEGHVPPDTWVDEARLAPAYANLMREIVHLPGVLPHLRALVALGLFHDKPDAEGLTPVQIAGWEGLPEVMGYLLSLSPDLSHVNGYGGTLLSTIVHGAENAPKAPHRDHIACARLALEQGVALPRRMPDLVGEPGLAAFLRDWAARHPGQVVAHGVA